MTPSLLYTTDEEDLRASLRAMLAVRAPSPEVLARTGTAQPYDDVLWRILAVDMGLAGLAVPEVLGGAGASLREVAVVLEELGRVVAPVPYLGSVVVATTALLSCGEQDLVRQLASGARRAALAVPFSTMPGALAATVTGPELAGTVTSVADALGADDLLVYAGTGLYIVDCSDPGVTLDPVVSLDGTRALCDITFSGVRGRLIAQREEADIAVARALLAGAALLASEQVGVAQWCLDSTVDYLKTRYQFGRPLGSFQALKHRLADVWVALTQARAVARYAAGTVAAGDYEAGLAAALAQAYCGPVALTAAQECIQLHGGIGFTWEHPAHLYLKRARSAANAFGSADQHRAALARWADLPA